MIKHLDFYNGKDGISLQIQGIGIHVFESLYETRISESDEFEDHKEIPSLSIKVRNSACSLVLPFAAKW